MSTWWSTGALVVSVVPLPDRTDQPGGRAGAASRTYSAEEFAVAFAPNACIGCGMDMTGQAFTQTVAGLTCDHCDPDGEGTVPPVSESPPAPAHPLRVLGLAPAPLSYAQIAEDAQRARPSAAPFDGVTPNVVPPVRTGPRRK